MDTCQGTTTKQWAERWQEPVKASQVIVTHACMQLAHNQKRAVPSVQTGSKSSIEPPFPGVNQHKNGKKWFSANSNMVLTPFFHMPGLYVALVKSLTAILRMHLHDALEQHRASERMLLDSQKGSTFISPALVSLH